MKTFVSVALLVLVLLGMASPVFAGRGDFDSFGAVREK